MTLEIGYSWKEVYDAMDARISIEPLPEDFDRAGHADDLLQLVAKTIGLAVGVGVAA